jgi:hypothetical protein
MFGWHRWKLGWFAAAQVACLAQPGTLTTRLMPVESAGGRKLAVVRVRQAAVAAEVRQPILEDNGICKGGVLVYRVELSQQLPRRPIAPVAARPDDPRRLESCGPRYNAPLGFDPGRRSVLRVGDVEIRVLGASHDGSYRIRLRRRR